MDLKEIVNDEATKEKVFDVKTSTKEVNGDTKLKVNVQFSFVTDIEDVGGAEVLEAINKHFEGFKGFVEEPALVPVEEV